MRLQTLMAAIRANPPKDWRQLAEHLMDEMYQADSKTMVDWEDFTMMVIIAIDTACPREALLGMIANARIKEAKTWLTTPNATAD